MQATKLLFTAPLDFDLSVWEKYNNTFLVSTGGFGDDTKVWVCQPKATYVIDDNILAEFPGLRILATPSTGTNHIDLDACKRCGIKVLSLNDNKEALADISASSEFTFKLILDALRKPPARELRGKTVGIVGLGRIGENIAMWCYDFYARPILSYDPYAPEMLCSRAFALDELFRFSDIVVICCSLTPETTGMITGDLLRSMKPGAALVNTARGEIIDEEALVAVMQERPDLRVALDVVCGEVTGTADRTRLRNLGAIVTDHVAGETYDSRTKAAQIIYDLLVEELKHE